MSENQFIGYVRHLIENYYKLETYKTCDYE